MQQEIQREPVFQRNTFLLLIHSAIVFLLGLGLLASFFNKGADIPKTAELKIYAAFVLLACAWFFLTPRYADQLERNYPLSWLFIGLYFPLVAVINSIGDFYTERTAFLFVIGLAGLILWFVESFILPPQREYPNIVLALHGGLIIAVLLTVLLSVGNTYNLLSFSSLIIYAVTWLMLKNVRLPLSDTTFVICIAAVLAPLFFLVRVGFIDIEHYQYFIGPVIEAANGHAPLAEIAPQYGAGMTIALRLYFALLGQITNTGLVNLLQFLTFVQFLLVFLIGWSLYRSRALAVCALLAALMFVYCSQGDKYFAFPSTGFLRFGIPLIITGLYCMPHEKFVRNRRQHFIAALAAIASLWSFESMIYTVPAVCAAEWMGGRLRKFLPLLGAYVLGLWSLYLLSLIVSGHMPDLREYLEYPLLFAKGFGQIPLERHTTLWWLFIPLALFGIAESVWNRKTDARITLLSVYALAIFTYFGGRAHPNNLHHIAVPFILLLFYYLSRIPNQKWKNAFAALIVTITASVNMSFFEEWSMARAMNILAGASFAEHFGSLPAAKFDDCTPYADFTQYVRNGELALLDATQSSYNIYTCVHAANAFGVNPFDASEVSPRASARAVEMAKFLPTQPVLIADSTISRPLATLIMNHLVLLQKKTVTIAGTQYWLYEGRGVETRE